MESNKSILVVLLAIACLQKYDQQNDGNKTWWEKIPVSEENRDVVSGENIMTIPEMAMILLIVGVIGKVVHG